MGSGVGVGVGVTGSIILVGVSVGNGDGVTISGVGWGVGEGMGVGGEMNNWQADKRDPSTRIVLNNLVFIFLLQQSFVIITLALLLVANKPTI